MTYATDYYVSAAAADDSKDCSSWDKACKTIARAISKANTDGDVVKVAEGIYVPVNEIMPVADISVIGGFKHGGSTSLSIDYPTIISGDPDAGDLDTVAGVTGDHENIQGTNRNRLFAITNHSFTLKNLTVTGFDAVSHGSAIYFLANTAGTRKLQLESVRVIGNRSIISGSMGAVAIKVTDAGVDASLQVTDSVFKGNRGDLGGAISFESSLGTASALIESSSFTENDAVGGDKGWGGAIYTDALLTVKSSLFDSNTATVFGGAISTQASNERHIVNSTFYGNKVLSAAGDAYGGAIRFSGDDSNGTKTIQYSTFYANTSKHLAGAIYNQDSGIYFMGNLIMGNTVNTVEANIDSTVANRDEGYNLIGAVSADGISVGGVAVTPSTTWLTGTGSSTATLTIDEIIETTLKDNGGFNKTLKIHSNSIARDKILNDGIVFFGQGQSAGSPFTSIKQATGALRKFESYAAGTYFFELEGQAFSTNVDDDGYVKIDGSILTSNAGNNEALEAGTITFTDASSIVRVKNIGLCNGSITTIDGRGLPRSDFTNPKDSNQYGDIHDCDMGAFEFNNGYQFDCYSEDGMRPVLDPVVDVENKSVDFSQTMCLGGDLATATPSAIFDNFAGSLNYGYFLTLGLLVLFRRK